jgi:hypothetical protein
LPNREIQKMTGRYHPAFFMPKKRIKNAWWVSTSLLFAKKRDSRNAWRVSTGLFFARKDNLIMPGGYQTGL